MALKETLSDFPTHLRTVCEFSLNRPPMRAKVDRQSFDELKPGVDAAIAVLDWFEQLQMHLAALVEALGHRKPSPGAEELQQLAQAVDCCVVMENQFSGWSACVNRFSWFKRTFGMLRKEVANDVDVDALNKNVNRFQGLIGNTQFPIGTHLTGPLRVSLKKVASTSDVMMAALAQLAEQVATFKNGSADPHLLRPLPFLIYLADGDTGPGSFNVFQSAAALKPVMRVFKRHPEVGCSPPPEVFKEEGESNGVTMRLAVVLQRCPHYATHMAPKWDAAADSDYYCESCCSVQ